MKNANELLKNPLAQPPPRREITSLEIDLIDYIFHKILMTWGDGKFWQTFSDEKTLMHTKRDWAKDLIAAIKLSRTGPETDQEFAFRAKSRVDVVFSEIRLLSADPQRKNWEWPSLKNIAAHMNSYRAHACHQAFAKPLVIEDQGAIARKKRAGKSELAKMRGMFS